MANVTFKTGPSTGTATAGLSTNGQISISTLPNSKFNLYYGNGSALSLEALSAVSAAFATSAASASYSTSATSASYATSATSSDYATTAGSAATASCVKDSGNNNITTFAYSKAGLSSVSWLGAWDSYELRAITPANALKSAIGTTAIGGTATPIYWNGSSFTTVSSTDKNVLQQNSTTSNYRPLLMGDQNDASATAAITSTTTGVLANAAIKAQPSTGQVLATSFKVANAVTLAYDSTNKCLNFNFA